MRRVLKYPPDSAALSNLSAVPFYNSKLRTTCVATLLQGGHAENALPQMAQATVNCRMLPGTNPTDVDATIRRIIGDTSVAITAVRPAIASPPSVLPPAVQREIQQVVTSL